MARDKAPNGGRSASREAKRPARTAKPASGRRKQKVSATHDRKSKNHHDIVPPQGMPHTARPQEPLKEIAEALAFPASARTIDHFVSAVLGRISLGVSPAGLMTAYFEWLSHLVVSPGKQIELVQKAARKATRFAVQTARATTDPETPPCIEPLPQDHRFSGEEWQQPPFQWIYQWFLLNQQWWHNATTGVHGVTPQNEKAIEFITRQLLDMASPSNFILTNPEVLQATLAAGGYNFVRGTLNFIEDWERMVAGRRTVGTEDYVVGRDVAVTPGKVILRNRLIELIQYTPVTATVHAEPVLIVPACIMKYYILDLSPHNSLVKYLVGQGYTVFMISWKNPVAEDRDLGMDDYRRLGIGASIKAIEAVVPGQKIHAAGYCLGGILLTTLAAALARDGEDTLKSLTLFTTELDYTEPGELMPFINESQVDYIEDLMWDQGYLDGKQFAGAFQLLRSNDLIWSRMLREYLLGERQGMTDLMAWNADATRVPYAMHSEVLRSLFLRNDLAEGHYLVDGQPAVISDIRVPIFCVATTRDHVAPWRSVYKIHLLTDTDVTFLLGSGGHNAGVVSEPGHRHRQYQVATRHESDRYVDADTWQSMVAVQEGSWWPEWQRWLAGHSGKKVQPPPMGAPEKGHPVIGDAPGRYVLQD
jgi:polyhydroxyalkanoate synthase subunit PhaC